MKQIGAKASLSLKHFDIGLSDDLTEAIGKRASGMGLGNGHAKIEAEEEKIFMF